MKENTDKMYCRSTTPEFETDILQLCENCPYENCSRKKTIHSISDIKKDCILTDMDISYIIDILFGESNNYKYYNIAENGIILNGLREPKEYVLRNEILTLLCELRKMNLCLTGVTMNHNNPPTLDEYKEKENERDTKYNKLSELITDILITQSQTETTDQIRPEETIINKPKADGNNKSQQIIDVDKLKDYFVPAFYNKQNVSLTDYFTENLIPDLKKNFTGKQFAAIALLIYNSDKIRKKVRPNSFNSWLITFCSLVGIKYTNYKQSVIKNISDKLAEVFYYLK